MSPSVVSYSQKVLMSLTLCMVSMQFEYCLFLHTTAQIVVFGRLHRVSEKKQVKLFLL